MTAATGTDRVISVSVSDGRSTRAVACDVLCTGYGLVPNVELARLLGCSVTAGGVGVDARQATSVPGVYAAGEVTGIGGVDLAARRGRDCRRRGRGCARASTPSLVRRRGRLRDAAARLERAFAVRSEIRALATDDTIVCRCEDVRRGAVASLRDARQAKFYARAGMGACQGRVCGPALEFLFGWPAGTVRAPLEPARLSTLAVAAAAHRSAAPSSALRPSSSGT